MRILVYGAGVIGSLYGGKLAAAGHDVTLLARAEQRRAELDANGVVLEEARSLVRTCRRLSLATRLARDDAYDLVLVAVARHQVEAVLPALRENAGSRSILFLVNTADRYRPWVDAVGRERFLAGYPGVAGEKVGAVVRYALLPAILQPTTLGGAGRPVPPALAEVARAFEDAGFPVATRPRVEDWQRTHAAIMTPLAQALLAAGGDVEALARSPRLLDLVVGSIRENFRVLEMDGVTVAPRMLAPLVDAPLPFLRMLLRKALGTPIARTAFVPHVLGAREEVEALAGELRETAQAVWLLTEASDRLEDAARGARQRLAQPA
jgi:2-dehydropantoate 2-reductase